MTKLVLYHLSQGNLTDSILETIRPKKERERKEERKKGREKKTIYMVVRHQISAGPLRQFSSRERERWENQGLERLCGLLTVTQPAQPNHMIEHRSELKPFDI